MMLLCSHFRKRDRAHQKVKRIFYEVIQQRRQSKEQDDDMLQTLIDAKYRCVYIFDSADFVEEICACTLKKLKLTRIQVRIYI